MEEMKYCQSCGMPLEKESDFGKNEDKSLNEEYCCYCYADGKFTNESITMDEMIELNLKINEENGCPMGPQKEAKKMMETWFPTLKRWKM